MLWRSSRVAKTSVLLFFVLVSAAHALEAHDEFVKRVFARERATIEYLSTKRPVLETYLQTTRDDGQPSHGDLYFLGEWDLSPASRSDSHVRPASLALAAGQHERSFGSLWGLSYTADPVGLSEMFFVDLVHFTSTEYLVAYEKEETIAGIRCAVFIVQPIPANAPGRVMGRIWVELESASIVRIHGKYTRDLNPLEGGSEFDSWRWRTSSGFWVPSYAYSESTEPNPAANLIQLRMRMSTLVWGYERQVTNLDPGSATPAPVLRSRLDPASKNAPEPKIVRWLDENGLLAHSGNVDQSVCNVARALMAASGLPPRPISCRVLMTSPLESFTVGQTIVVSRGLLDLVPDEPSLAAVIAHEVAHVLLGYTDPPPVDAVGNIFMSGVPKELRFHGNAGHERAARLLAAQLVRSSPYADTLDRLMEFAAAIGARRKDLRHEFRARFGGDIADELVALAGVVNTGREVHPGALPLGSRIELDPSSNEIKFAVTYRGILSRTFPFGVAARVPALFPDPVSPSEPVANPDGAVGAPIPGDSWATLPETVSTKYSLPIRFAGDKKMDGLVIKILTYQAKEEDHACQVRTGRGLFGRVWRGAVPCWGEVWTDEQFNILRIMQDSCPPTKYGIQRFHDAILYAWVQPDGSAEKWLVPARTILRVKMTDGRAYDTFAAYSNYHLFAATTKINFSIASGL